MNFDESPSSPEYDCPAFWDRRYKSSPEAFDWYQDYTNLRRLIRAIIPLEAQILQVGVGTSNLQADMADDGYKSIVNIDISPASIEILRERHKDQEALQYLQADCRTMPQFPDGNFDFVVDKGTVDALLCGSNAVDSAGHSMREIHRVLKPGGAFVCITYGPPGIRLGLFADPAAPFSVLVYAIKKPEGDTRSTTTCHFIGPFHAADPVQREKLCAMKSSRDKLHWFYMCLKVDEGAPPPPTLDAPDGGRPGSL